jgi:hypothetical protein
MIHAQPVRTLLLSLLGLAACGGAKHAGTVSNAVPTGPSPLADGSYACEFVVDGTAMGPHHCQVTHGKLDKTSGMEPFTGTVTGTSDQVRVDAAIGCTPMSVKCHQPFTLTLAPTTGGIWRGKVETSATGDWFLRDQQFEIGPDNSLGGEGYGASGGGAGGGE